MKYVIQYTATSSYEATEDTDDHRGYQGDPEDADAFADWLEKNSDRLKFGDFDRCDTDDTSVTVLDCTPTIPEAVS